MPVQTRIVQNCVEPRIEVPIDVLHFAITEAVLHALERSAIEALQLLRDLTPLLDSLRPLIFADTSTLLRCEAMVYDALLGVRES